MIRKPRARGALPANWVYRANPDGGGRPRWVPGPSLRKAGWKGRDLKGPDGAWLSEGASIDLARSINAAVDAWRAGQLVPAAYADMAPAGAADTPAATRAELTDRRCIGRLLDAYLGDAKDRASGSRKFKTLGAKTQLEYRSKLSRLVDVLAGYVVQPGRDATPAQRAAYEDARQAVRGLSIDVLDPPPFGSTQKALLHVAYWRMRDHAGHHMANGCLAVTSAWLEWCKSADCRAIQLNAAKAVDRDHAPGRIRVASWDELRALIAAAEALGYASIGDAVVLGVDLSWNQGDRLALTWDRISAEHRVRATRLKTGRAGETRLLASLGQARLPKIRERQAAMFGDNAQPTHVIICETTKAPWKADHYRHTFAEVRAHAAQTCPAVADLRDQDLRDTAVTMAYEAGLEIPEIASRTLHSLAQIGAILDAHYGAINRRVGDNGADKLDAYLANEKVGL